MRILNINNDKGFTNEDMSKVKKLLPPDFKIKRKSRGEFAIYYTGIHTNTDGMFEFLHDRISKNFKPKFQ